MKLATRRDGTRDGALYIVDRNLKAICSAQDLAPTLQHALDHWQAIAPKLEERAAQLASGRCAGIEGFDAQEMMAPLPRAYQWADGSAYVHHVALVRRARGASMPPSFWEDPLMYQGGSDAFLGPCDPIPLANLQWGLDFESEIAVVTDDVPQGIDPEAALGHIRLLMLVNDVSLRELIPSELAKGFGFFQSKPSSACSPVAVTPDELGVSFREGKIHLPLYTFLNGELFGKPNAGVDMVFHFGQLIAHAAATRSLSAGTIIGSGTVSNEDPQAGSSCIVERRMLEILSEGEAKTPYMCPGDRIKIEMRDEAGRSIFGAIDQRVEEKG